MAPLAADGRPHGALALVSDHDGHARRLADEATLLAHGPAARDARRGAGRRRSRPPRRRRGRDGSAGGAAPSACGSTAARQTAKKPFMSQAPRPYSRPSACLRRKGSLDQVCPSTGTTSVWPDRMKPGTSVGPTDASTIGFLAGRIIDPLAPNPEALQIAPRPSRPAGGWSCGSSCRTAPASTEYQGPCPHPFDPPPAHHARLMASARGSWIKPLFIRSIRS